MKRILFSAVAALTLSAAGALAADLPVKAVPVVAPPPPAWDIAFGAALASDYRFRGISQSDRKPSVSAYFEPRYNFDANWQIYVGMAGASINFPNRAAAEIDFYGGIRPTFGPLALDLGVLYYWYPGGACYATVPSCFDNPPLPNGNIIKKDLSFLEGYFRGIWTVIEPLQLGFNAYYTDSFLNSGAEGFYGSGTIKWTFASLPSGVGFYLSGEAGYQYAGRTDGFYGNFNLPDYATWNAGLGITYKVLTLDLRYIDTDLSKAECNAFTSDQFARPNAIGVVESKWCGATFVAKLSADLTLNANVK
jgi:Bacterial protein of unknown function (Gcw_chp)